MRPALRAALLAEVLTVTLLAGFFGGRGAAALTGNGATGAPTGAPTRAAFLYSSTLLSIPTTPTTCDAASPTWCVPSLQANQVMGAGLHFDPTTNTFTVDADTAYISISGDAEMNTFPGAQGVGSGSGTVTFEVLDATTKSTLHSLASVSGSWNELFSASAQTVSGAGVVIPRGHTFGFIFFASFCNWVNWSKSFNLVIDVYKDYRAPASSPSSALSYASPVSRAPSRSPVLSTSVPSMSPSISPPLVLLSSTLLTIPNTATTCDVANPNWAVPRPQQNRPIGAGLHLDSSTYTFTVDANIAYISITGDAEMNTFPGANGVGSGSGSVTFEVLDASTKSTLQTLASVSGAWYDLYTEPTQSVSVKKLVIPAGHPFGFVFSASFCNWVNWSKANNLIITVYMNGNGSSNTSSPTSAVPTQSIAQSTIIGASVGAFLAFCVLAGAAFFVGRWSVRHRAFLTPPLAHSESSNVIMEATKVVFTGQTGIPIAKTVESL